MSLDSILKLLQDVPEFRAACDAIRRDSSTVQLEGVTSAAKAAFIAALHGQLRRPVLLITYGYEQAEALYDDLAAFGFDSDDLLLVPPSEGMTYQEGDTDLDIIGRRLSALARLQEDGPTIIVTPIGGLLQRTMPPAVLASHRVLIENGESLDLEECARRLVQLGYERTLMVERQGEFSQRGGIIDIFPSTDETPYRIELFGDEVESIRSFDTETQRSAGEIAQLNIAPAREALLSRENADNAVLRLTELLSAAADDLDADAYLKLSDRVQDDIARIENLAYFDGTEYYLPVIYPQAHCLLDYLPADALVVMDEPHQVKSHWEQLHEELLEAQHARIQRGDILPLPEDHVVPFERAAEILSKRGRNLLLSLLSRTVAWLNPDIQIPLSSGPMDAFGGQVDVFSEQLRTWLANDARIVLVTNQTHRLVELLTEKRLSTSDLPAPGKNGAGIYVMDGQLRSGFKMPGARLMVATDGEIFGFAKFRRPRKTFKRGLAISSLLELNEGDYVVHINHGIGRYMGLTKLEGTSGDRDYLLVEYQGVDRLYVPVDQIDRIQKYIGAEGHPPTLNRLGGTEWARTTKRVKQAAKEMAKELLQLYAARQALQGYSFGPDTPWQQELESAFPYEETPDQLETIQEVKQDLEAPKPMDRLVCGDVGYGKTEVAIRAVFKVINEGKQAAVLSPTTVLAQQHLNTFKERLAAYPVKVEMLSRFRSRAEQRKVIEELRTGAVDLVIGTHRLLSKDIEFRDLGLLVVDEEQRFGVAHKERLKQLRKTVDVLTLTATPIPRTLQMSLSGIRDMSVIDDPPEGRIPIKTYCKETDDELLRDAILRELDRDGQVYFVHNRVENIEHVADHVRRLVPYARIEIGHGQMNEDELEAVMLDFYEHKFDVLVCTTIIESGLDIPNANTIVINNADKLGLAQLYQLRGRVGRSNRQAYAYLLYEPYKIMTEIAEKRLQAIKEFSDLGSGFRIALRDLEIRGAGNLLGAEQHGQMAAVGFDMYCQLLSEAVAELKGEEPEQFDLPPADLPMDAFIPTDYIPVEALRLSFYKKMTAVRGPEDIDEIEDEMRDRFGDMPTAVRNSLDILRLRLKASGIGISAIVTEKRHVVVKFATGIRMAPDICHVLKKQFRGTVFMGDKVIVDGRHPHLLQNLYKVLEALPAALDESKQMYLSIL